MTCKDCVHRPVCVLRTHWGVGSDWNDRYTPDVEKRCKEFKAKADVVVRCKECVHWGGVALGNVCKRWSSPLTGLKNLTSPDDFCSYGEKEGDDYA